MPLRRKTDVVKLSRRAKAGGQRRQDRERFERTGRRQLDGPELLVATNFLTSASLYGLVVCRQGFPSRLGALRPVYFRQQLARLSGNRIDGCQETWELIGQWGKLPWAIGQSAEARENMPEAVSFEGAKVRELPN